MAEAYTGPVTLFTGYSDPELRGKDGELIAAFMPHRLPEAKRFAACWNACDGIPSALLTGGETLAHYTGQVIAQRDELLAELEKIATSVDIDTLREAIDCDRNAIAKVKGGAV